MILRMSTLLLRTLRDDPADAEVPSHRLLVRAGYVRRVAPGVFSWLPLGYLAFRNVERIVRAHGGTVAVSSVEGEGTAFTLRLPSAPVIVDPEEAHLG